MGTSGWKKDPYAKEKCDLAIKMLQTEPDLLVVEAAERVGVKPMTLYKRLNRAEVKQDTERTVRKRRTPKTYKTKRRPGRPKGSMSEEMKKKKERAINLVLANPTLSIARVARHVGVSETTASKWFDEAQLKRWFP